jgi:CxxH/CxxC protein (TIGR04129 family)
MYILIKNGVDKMYVVCNKHLEDAIEDFVEAYEQSPDVYELEQVSFTDWASPKTCNYCDRQPKYLVV